VTGWERCDVTVLVDDELSFEAVDGIHVFRSRRPFELLISPRHGIPRCQLEPAVLLWAGYDATSGAELEVRRMCRRFSMPPPDRQRGRTDRAGKRRWTDCEWDLPNGTTLVLEVAGAFHIEVRQQGDDYKRARRITTRNRMVVRPRRTSCDTRATRWRPT
jgi:hypothetical protein